MDYFKKLLTYDNGLRTKHNTRLVCGVDEAGRGAWASIIVAAAVIFDDRPLSNLDFLRDSKKLSETIRMSLESIIKQQAAGFGVYCMEATEIDKYGIDACNKICMTEAAKKALEMYQDLLDGEEHANPIYVVDQCPGFGLHPQIMMPKADDTSLAVAAASVLAKNFRDIHLINLSNEYPEYSFETHKGYVNEVHKQAVLKHGIIKGVHRKSYKINGVNKPLPVSLAELMEGIN